MANTKQSIKRARQAVKRRAANQMVKTNVRSVVKRVRAAAVAVPAADDNADNAADNRNLYVKMQSTVDKAARKGLLHPEKSARLKSRINRQIKAANTAATDATAATA